MKDPFTIVFGMIAISVVSLTTGCAGSPAGEPGGAIAASPLACDALSSIDVPNATITVAESVAAGAFVPPVQEGARPQSAEAIAAQYGGLPAFCRVAATLRPSDDSDIKIEVWMPAADSNGKYQAVGNGAFTGSIRYGNMATALGRTADDFILESYHRLFLTHRDTFGLSGNDMLFDSE